jgi:hypothetical protein
MVLVAVRELETSRRGWLERVVSCLPWHRYNTDTTPLTTVSHGIPQPTIHPHGNPQPGTPQTAHRLRATAQRTTHTTRPSHA